jgi:hypothetical protein
MKHRVHVEEEVAVPVLAPKPISGKVETNMRVVREALKDVPPTPKPPAPLMQPPPQQKLGPPPMSQPPPSAPPEPALAAWEPKISPETEERINRIWADYVAGKPPPRPEPRIRSLSDDREWGVPPWWKGKR